MEAARALAEDLGTTPNDAIVRLAEEGIAASEKRRAVERLVRERRQAALDLAARDAPSFPSPEEMRAAMLSGRQDP
ncbi:MAG: hypothetical protein QOJ25_522 [Solirubrobacteraceae bacterium]|jgi:hypothetical protein|nr:hypothetical protein [Solirubrobacteraceae bacterium]